MPKSVNQYVNAAIRDNTRKSYRAAIEHFEATWGGFLPTTADTVARYLAEHAESLSINTLRQRLAAIAAWHLDQGFPDPTKAPHVKKVLKRIVELHPQVEKRARPLGIEELATIVALIEHMQSGTEKQGERLRLSRDKAILLLGFWRAFRSDELSRIEIEHVEVVPGQGMTLFIPRSKGDRSNRGTHYRAPALKQLCPVDAYLDWIHQALLTSGPVFRGISRWGHISDEAMHPTSIINIVRGLCEAAGLEDSSSFSSHSLRRGFANWANHQQWDVKELMDYVGWKDVQSAMRYIDSQDPFTQQKIEGGLGTNKTKSISTDHK